MWKSIKILHSLLADGVEGGWRQLILKAIFIAYLLSKDSLAKFLFLKCLFAVLHSSQTPSLSGTAWKKQA